MTDLRELIHLCEKKRADWSSLTSMVPENVYTREVSFLKISTINYFARSLCLIIKSLLTPSIGNISVCPFAQKTSSLSILDVSPSPM